MSKLTDDTLIKRATHAGRNLSILAILASLGAVGLVVVLVLARDTALLIASVFSVALVVIATGYWLLAVAAKRGNPSSVGTVIAVMVLQLTLTLVTYGIAAAKGGANEQPNALGSVIPILVIIALVNSRNVLIELRTRGLWEQIFGSAKPSGRLCLAGSILVVLGFIGLNASTVYAEWRTGQARQQELQHVQRFFNMIQSEEAAFMKAMGVLSGPYGVEDVQEALETVVELEQEARAIEEATAEMDSFDFIAGTYCNAVRQWKNALTLLNETEPDVERAQQMLLLGDKLRVQAGQEFDRRYAPRP
jgi:hypothetical protein